MTPGAKAIGQLARAAFGGDSRNETRRYVTEDTVNRQTNQDNQLIEEAKQGDRAAFQALVRKYQSKAFRIAFGVLRSREDAEDVVQESFVKAYIGLENFRGQSTFYTWLYRIVYNMAIDLKRKQTRQGGEPVELQEEILNSEDSATSLLGRVESPHAALTRKEQAARLTVALGEMSEEHRTVLTLREFDGLSYEEIANVTGVTKGTVMSRLHYARKRLQAILQEGSEEGEVEKPERSGLPDSTEELRRTEI